MMNTFFIADTHFDHANIIRYCSRPFKSVEEMNGVMLSRWNATVGPEDLVFFLGDLTFGRNRRHMDYWLEKLHGRIIFIVGSHDTEKSRLVEKENYMILGAERSANGTMFYLVHDTLDVPTDWKGWVIHGHNHNNSPVNYPLVSKRYRRINVSVEMIDYTPVSMERILEWTML